MLYECYAVLCAPKLNFQFQLKILGQKYDMPCGRRQKREREIPFWLHFWLHRQTELAPISSFFLQMFQFWTGTTERGRRRRRRRRRKVRKTGAKKRTE